MAKITVQDILATPNNHVKDEHVFAADTIITAAALDDLVKTEYGGVLFLCASHYAALITDATLDARFMPTTNRDEIIERGLVGRYDINVEVFTDIFLGDGRIRMQSSFFLPNKEPQDTYWKHEQVIKGVRTISVVRNTIHGQYEVEKDVRPGKTAEDVSFGFNTYGFDGSKRISIDVNHTATSVDEYLDMLKQATDFMTQGMID